MHKMHTHHPELKHLLTGSTIAADPCRARPGTGVPSLTDHAMQGRSWYHAVTITSLVTSLSRARHCSCVSSSSYVPQPGGSTIAKSHQPPGVMTALFFSLCFRSLMILATTKLNPLLKMRESTYGCACKFSIAPEHPFCHHVQATLTSTLRWCALCLVEPDG